MIISSYYMILDTRSLNSLSVISCQLCSFEQILFLDLNLIYIQENIKKEIIDEKPDLSTPQTKGKSKKKPDKKSKSSLNDTNLDSISKLLGNLISGL